MSSTELTFDSYQRTALTTAIYPEQGTGSAMALAYVGLGLGEAGEVQGKIKKILRDDNGEVTDAARNALNKEIGDLLWYAAQLASELGTSLGSIAQDNIFKLSARKERGTLTGSGDER